MQTLIGKSKLLLKNIFSFSIENEKVVSFGHNFYLVYPFWGRKFLLDRDYFFRYITSLINLTVRATSGKAAATKFGA
jgi:hypothetical protein